VIGPNRVLVPACLALTLLVPGSIAQQTNSPLPTGAATAPAASSPASRQSEGAARPSAPEVTYQGGQLSINSQGSTLVDLLKAIAQKTGAVIDVPAGGGSEAVFAHSGPGTPDAVLRALLTGSDFNFVILTPPRTPHNPVHILLFQRGPAGEAVPESVAEAPSSGTEPQLYGAGFVVSGEEAQSPEETPAPAQHNDPPDAIPGATLDQMQKEFLRQHQQQQQQKQQEQQGAAPPSSQ